VPRPVRLKDIAKDLGVSAAAVCKALRDAPDISPDLKQRVRKRARQLGYQPDLAARSLATRRSYAVGLVIPDLSHSFFAEIARGAARVLHARGYTLVLADSDENPNLERQAVEQLLGRRVDGMILASAQPAGDASLFQRIREHRTPFVLVDRQHPGHEADFAGSDNCELGRLATAHLIRLGRRRIAHLACRQLATGPGRFEGYRRALAECGIGYREELVVDCRNTDAGGREAMAQLLGREPRPDAVFCFSDPVAAGAEQAILEAGLRIPADIAVIGAGNVHYSGLFRVPLSTVDMNSPVLGERAAEMLLERMAGNKEPPRSVMVPLQVLARQSSEG